MPIDVLLAYTTLTFLYCLAPGPAVLLTASQAITRGFPAGFAVAVATQVGNLIYFAISVLGLGALLLASETAFTIVKYAGAAYLIYLGARTIVRAPHAAEPGGPERVPLWRHPFAQGLVNQLANPKSILFWGALVPQFVDYRAGNLPLQLALIAGIAVVADLIVLSGYGWLAARGGRFMAAGPLAVWRERMSGAMLIVVGGALSLIRRAEA